MRTYNRKALDHRAPTKKAQAYKLMRRKAGASVRAIATYLDVSEPAARGLIADVRRTGIRVERTKQIYHAVDRDA